MADGPVQDAVAGAMRALRMLDAGIDYDAIPTSATGDLEYVERRLGLTRRLQSYAPRTRRRYLAGARQGTNAKKVRERERVIRKSGAKTEYGLTPNQLTRLNRYRIPIMESGVDNYDYLEAPVIKDIVQMYGFDYMLTVLREEYDSIYEYTKGNKGPGNRRWNARGTHEAVAEGKMAKKFGAVVYTAQGTDPYYYYHGTIR